MKDDDSVKNILNVCIVTPYYHPVKGGVTTYVSGLFDTLDKRENIHLNMIMEMGEKTDNRTHTIGAMGFTFVRIILMPNVIAARENQG